MVNIAAIICWKKDEIVLRGRVRVLVGTFSPCAHKKCMYICSDRQLQCLSADLSIV